MLFKKKKDESAEIFEDNAPVTVKQSIKNTIALKRNVYAIVLSVIFIVAVILVNVFSTIMAERFPIEIDLTKDKLHSMTEENIDFIRSIDKPINIYVCLKEEQFDCSDSDNMAQLAAEQYFVDYSSANYEYFVQSAELLNKIARYNDNINLTYLDMNEAQSALIATEFDEYEYKKGDILIECPTVGADGKETYRRTAVLFQDIYTLEGNTYTEYYKQYAALYGNMALYGQGAGYAITENKMEMAVSSAIYKVVSENTPVFLVPTNYYDKKDDGTIIVDEYLKNLLNINNYEIDYAEGNISTLLAGDGAAQYEGIILAGCKEDISNADYEAILNFLDNSGNKGKSLFYFAGLDVATKMPKLTSLMAEWGIGYLDGVLYETSADNRVMTDETGDPKDFYHASTGTDYTARADGKGYYVVGNTVPMKLLYSSGVTATYTRVPEVVMRTGGNTINPTTTIMPSGEDSTKWKPASNAECDIYPTIIACKDENVLEDQSYAASYIVAFATDEYISGEWVKNWSNVANDHAVLDMFNAVSGMSETPFKFVSKTITEERFSATETNQLTVKIIFMAILPILVLASGITVWVVRKRK